MEFHIDMGAAAPDLVRLVAALEQADPAVLVDWQGDSGLMRIATWLEAGDIAAAFATIGQPLALARIRIQPSVCCGGCSG